MTLDERQPPTGAGFTAPVKKAIGIIGGMGPLATCDLMERIIKNTLADRDQDFPRIFVDCNTSIPDRTNYIINRTGNPVDEMKQSATLLQQMGAQLLCMPCNTAHYYLEELRQGVQVPIVNMIGETMTAIGKLGYQRAALLATEGTINSGLYSRYAEQRGIELLVPRGEDETVVMDLIYRGVKAGNSDFDTGNFRAVLKRLQEAGAERFILGCTELPLAFRMYHLDWPVIDPTDILAKAVVIAAGYPLREA